MNVWKSKLLLSFYLTNFETYVLKDQIFIMLLNIFFIFLGAGAGGGNYQGGKQRGGGGGGGRQPRHQPY